MIGSTESSHADIVDRVPRFEFDDDGAVWVKGQAAKNSLEEMRRFFVFEDQSGRGNRHKSENFKVARNISDMVACEYVEMLRTDLGKEKDKAIEIAQMFGVNYSPRVHDRARRLMKQVNGRISSVYYPTSPFVGLGDQERERLKNSEAKEDFEESAWKVRALGKAQLRAEAMYSPTFYPKALQKKLRKNRDSGIYLAAFDPDRESDIDARSAIEIALSTGIAVNHLWNRLDPYRGILQTACALNGVIAGPGTLANMQLVYTIHILTGYKPEETSYLAEMWEHLVSRLADYWSIEELHYWSGEILRATKYPKRYWSLRDKNQRKLGKAIERIRKKVSMREFEQRAILNGLHTPLRKGQLFPAEIYVIPEANARWDGNRRDKDSTSPGRYWIE